MATRYGVEEVKKVLKVGEKKAYRIIKEINDRLFAEGMIIVHGTIPEREYNKLVAEQKSKKLIAKLNFEESVKLYNSLPTGHIMIDWLFDHMEKLDEERFERFLDGNE